MDEHTLLVIMATFVAVAGVALGFQAATLFGIYRASKSTQETINRLAPKIETFVETSRAAIQDSREVLDATKQQLETIQDLVTDGAVRARRQMDHAELVLDDAMDRAQSTIAAVHKGVIKPIREINAVATGLRAAIHYFMRGTRPSPDQVTVDEEMFI